MFAFLDTDGSFDFQPRDISYIIERSVDVDENMKMQIINNCMPRENFKFLERRYTDKSRNIGMRSLYCRAFWFKRYQFIVYSVNEDGVFCLLCIFFPIQPTHGFQAKFLISKPYTNWKKINDDLSIHETLQYHLTSMACLLQFKKTFCSQIHHQLQSALDVGLATQASVHIICWNA